MVIPGSAENGKQTLHNGRHSCLDQLSPAAYERRFESAAVTTTVKKSRARRNQLALSGRTGLIQLGAGLELTSVN